MTILSILRGISTKYPYAVTSIQVGTLMAAGDLISQTFVEKRKKIEWDRTARFGMIGVAFMGPLLKTWYGILERHICLKTPFATACSKMMVDQACFAPVVIVVFIGLLGYLHGSNLEMIKNDLSKNYVDILLTNYTIWPAAQIINFSVIPFQHRVLFAQSVALVWNTYLAWKTNQNDASSSAIKLEMSKQM